jgi:hypothetical protein
MFLLLAVVFVAIILLSQKHLHAPPYQALHPQTQVAPASHKGLPPSTITVTAPPVVQTILVEPPVEPVVFALIMYSVSSAKEGAILLKVLLGLD